MWKSEKVFVLLVISLSVFAACGRARSNVDANSQTAAKQTRQVTDDLGRTITIPSKVTRVVSLAPNLTENIFAVGAGDRLVGVTTFCNYPDEARSIAKIGDTMTPNMESIVALKPDIVFVSTASQIEAFMKTLEANGIAVYVTNPNGLEDVLKNLKQLGELFGTQERAASLNQDLQRRIDQVREKVNGERSVRSFVQISQEPLFSIGKESFMTPILEAAGGESVTREVATAFPKLNPEAAAAFDPDVIILSESDDNREPNPAFKNSKAVKNGRVISINADLLSRPGPRLVDALELIAKGLHPAKFDR